MTEDNPLDASRALEEAWSQLSQGQRKSARGLAQRAASLDPGSEGPWLILAALGTPEESLQYLQRVLEINPDNQRAIQGLQWARQRIRTKNEFLASSAVQTIPQNFRQTVLESAQPAEADTPDNREERFNELERSLISKGCVPSLLDETNPVKINSDLENARNPAVIPVEKKEHTQPVKIMPTVTKTIPKPKAQAGKQKPPLSRGKVAAAVATGLVLCLFLSAAVVIPFSNLFFPTFVSANALEDSANSKTEFSSTTSEPASSQEGQEIPSNTEINASPESDLSFATPTGVPTITYAPSFTPMATETQVFTQTPTATETPIQTNTPPPTVVAIPVQQSDIQTANNLFSGRWIDVDLANQMVYAYEDDQIVREFLVSTGTAAHPTVTGQFHIYLKYRYDDMVGPGYYLRDVPYVMYFYKGYGLHGTFWHDNFGTPMSHGCVNMRTDEAAWLYDFAPMGTLVNVH
ncbi:MAG: L,D-transpeptidase family protein [Anaerolineaceae bacterium]